MTARALWRAPAARALIALAGVVALGCVFHADGAFFKWSVHRDMLRQVSVYGVLACGMTAVIITAGIDLSVSSLLALSAVLFASLSLEHGLSGWASVPLVLAAGAGLGAVNGGLVARWRIQPFIATLAMMVFARGLAKQLSGGRKITNYVVGADGEMSAVPFPPIFEVLDGRVLGGEVAVVTLVFAACAGITWVVLARLRVGRYLYAIGGNEAAARLSGVPVGGSLVFAYALSGLFAAAAGICQAAQETHGDPETGMAYELDAIAMVVIGGTHLMGGRGGVGLTLIGALTIGYLQKILSLNAAPEATRLMLTGAIITAAVLFQRSEST